MNETFASRSITLSIIFKHWRIDLLCQLPMRLQSPNSIRPDESCLAPVQALLMIACCE